MDMWQLERPGCVYKALPLLLSHRVQYMVTERCAAVLAKQPILPVPSYLSAWYGIVATRASVSLTTDYFRKWTISTIVDRLTCVLVDSSKHFTMKESEEDTKGISLLIFVYFTADPTQPNAMQCSEPIYFWFLPVGIWKATTL